MASIKILNLHSKTIHCSDKSKRLLDILLEETDWMHSCGGKGKCTTCSAIVHQGIEHFSAPSSIESRFAGMGKLRPDRRLVCQCKVHGDVTISVPKIYQLPHLSYSN